MNLFKLLWYLVFLYLIEAGLWNKIELSCNICINCFNLNHSFTQKFFVAICRETGKLRSKLCIGKSVLFHTNIQFIYLNRKICTEFVKPPFQNAKPTSRWFLSDIQVITKWPTFPQACNFIKKETLTQVFFCELCEISKKTVFTQHLWATASKRISTFQVCLWFETTKYSVAFATEYFTVSNCSGAMAWNGLLQGTLNRYLRTALRY